MPRKRTPQHLLDRAEEAIAYAKEAPFDAPAGFWEDTSTKPPPRARNWQHRAARAVIAELQGRESMRQVLGEVEQPLAGEIVATITEIIRLVESRRR